MAATLLQDYCLGLLLAARNWRRIADGGAEAFGLSEATAYPLVFMSRLGDGLRQSALAEAIGIEGPSLVRLLDQLCALGLVTRREDASDKRAKTLHLTEAGQRVAADLKQELDLLRADTFASVSREDLAASLRVFSALQDATERRSTSQAGRALA